MHNHNHNPYFLVNLVLPNSGDTVSIRDYIGSLLKLGFSQKRAIASLGGISGRSAVLKNGYVTRL